MKLFRNPSRVFASMIGQCLGIGIVWIIVWPMMPQNVQVRWMSFLASTADLSSRNSDGRYENIPAHRTAETTFFWSALIPSASAAPSTTSIDAYHNDDPPPFRSVSVGQDDREWLYGMAYNSPNGWFEGDGASNKGELRAVRATRDGLALCIYKSVQINDANTSRVLTVLERHTRAVEENTKAIKELRALLVARDHQPIKPVKQE